MVIKTLQISARHAYQQPARTHGAMLMVQLASRVPVMSDGGQPQRPVRRVNAQREESNQNVMMTLPAQQIHVTPRMAAAILLIPAGVLLTMCVIRTILSILIMNVRLAYQKTTKRHGQTTRSPVMMAMHAQRMICAVVVHVWELRTHVMTVKTVQRTDVIRVVVVTTHLTMVFA